MKYNVPVGISNHHVHLTEEIYRELFDSEIEKDRDILQGGEYASTSFVSLIGPKGVIEHVRVMGPLRNYNQVEISASDAFLLGVNPPVRQSGNLENAESITIEANGKTVELKNACILAENHIHMNEKDLEKYGVKNQEVVKVYINGLRKGVLYAHIKAGSRYVLEYHIDRDEANAFLLHNGEELTFEVCSKSEM